MRLARLAMIIAFAAVATAARAESAYTTLDLNACEVLKVYEESGGVELRCDGYGGIDVFVSEGDARMEVDYGSRNENFESFGAFNGVGETVEWMLDDDGVPYAAALRFHLDNDGTLGAQALVVARIGSTDAPGCVVGVVDAATEQANGIARGLGALAPIFDCASDKAVIVPGASELVLTFSGANNN